MTRSSEVVIDAETAYLMSKLRQLQRIQSQIHKEGDSGFRAARRGFADQTKVAGEYAQKLTSVKKKIEDVKEQINAINRQGANLAVRGAENIYASWAKVSAILNAGNILGSIIKIVQAQKDYNRELASTVESQDTIVRKLQVQSAMQDKEMMEHVVSDIMPAVRSTGSTLENALLVEMELISQGVAKKYATAAMKEMITGMKSSNFEGNPRDFVKGIISLEKSRGTDMATMNAENFANINRMLVTLFSNKPLEGADLPRIAEIADLASGQGVSTEELFSAIATMKEGGMPVEKVTTALRNLILRMNIQSLAEPTKMKFLEAIGMDSESASITDRGLTAVIGELAERRNAAINKRDFDAALGKVIEVESIAPVATLLAKIDSYNESMKSLSSKSSIDAYTQRASIALSGPAARANIIKSQRDVEVYYEELEKSIKVQARDYLLDREKRDLGVFLGNLNYYTSFDSGLRRIFGGSLTEFEEYQYRQLMGLHLATLEPLLETSPEKPASRKSNSIKPFTVVLPNIKDSEVIPQSPVEIFEERINKLKEKSTSPDSEAGVLVSASERREIAEQTELLRQAVESLKNIESTNRKTEENSRKPPRIPPPNNRNN